MDTKLFLTVMLAIIAASAVKFFLSSFFTVVLKIFFKKTFIRILSELIGDNEKKGKSWGEMMQECEAENKAKQGN